MTTIRFTRDEFETALPRNKTTHKPIWQYAGFIEGEHCYRVKIDEKVAIMIRSSVGRDGLAADTGEDSIRAWLINIQTDRPLGKSASRWTTRVPGWEKRLINVIKDLWRWRAKAGDCQACLQSPPKHIFKAKKEGANKGRMFAKCMQCGEGFTWLT